MKMIAFIILITCLHVSATGFSQKITISAKNAPLHEVFMEISRQTGISILYKEALMQKTFPVTIDVKNAGMQEVMDLCIKNQPINYTIEDHNIVIKKSAVNNWVINPFGLPVIPVDSTIIVKGRIYDNSGKLVPNVSITVNNGPGGTISNDQGEFSIKVNKHDRLTFSSIGYEAQTITVNGRTSLNIILRELALKLTDAVVVGYGSARRKDVTGAISSVSTKDFNQGIISNPVQQIQGKVSGLQITQPGGDPNQTPIIRLRGQTSLTGGQTPLFVVDGVPLDDASQIVNIPPGDISSYDVLKDASATAIYGSRGANGVIIVNTKKGRAGKALVEYTGSVGVDRISQKYDLLNASEYKAAVGTNGSGYDHGANTDWMDAITRTAVTQSHNLAISGGTENFNYRSSLSYINQDGIVINTGKEETGLRLNAQQKALRNKLDIQLGIVSTITNRKYADYNIFLYAINTPPTFPVYNSDGSYYGYYDFDQQNPVATQMMQTNKAREKFTQLYGTVNYELIKDLKVGVTGSRSNFDILQDFYKPSLPLGEGNSNVNSGYKYSQNRYSKKGDIHVSYLRDWNKHNLTLTFVHEYSDFIYENYKAAGQEYLLDENENNSLQNGNSAKNTINSYKEEFQLASFLARAAYNFNSKYYITASIRRDGSSKFGVNNRWGSFPSFSLAWRLSNENILKDMHWVNELKLSAGYGVTGNQDAIDPYRTLLLLGSGGRYYSPSSSTNQYPQSYSPSQNANPDLKWEERHGRNIGLDFALFDNRLGGNMNVFNDKTQNLLFNYTVPTPPNYTNTVLANVGDLSNKGFEVQLNGNIIKEKDFAWSLSGQITFVKTKITSLSGSWNGTSVTTDNIGSGVARGRGMDGGYISYLKVGYAPYIFYLPHYLGVDDNGNQLFESASGPDHDINNAIRHYIDPSPKFNYGISNTLTYKRLSLNCFLRGVYGQKMFNNTRLIIDNAGRLPSNNVTKQALTNGIKDNTPVVSDLWLQNASFLRLDNTTLSYTFGSIKGIESLRVFLTGNNLFVITPYKGLDPEVANGDNDQAYIDYTYGDHGYYPKMRSVVIGVNLSLK